MAGSVLYTVDTNFTILLDNGKCAVEFHVNISNVCSGALVSHSTSWNDESFRLLTRETQTDFEAYAPVEINKSGKSTWNATWAFVKLSFISEEFGKKDSLFFDKETMLTL